MPMLDFNLERLDADFGVFHAPKMSLRLFMLVFSLAAYGLIRLAEYCNRFDYESRLARITSGFLMLFTRMFHTSNNDLVINTDEKKLITAGPHRTGWEAFALASKMRGTPPSFLATDAFNYIPGISAFMNMFRVIQVEAKATRSETGQSANAGVLEKARKVIEDNGCIALFPQGNFSRLGQKPHMVYSGAAKIAIANNLPVHVIRLDGFWCLQNPLIPMFVKNSALYRAFFSMFHMNNVRATACCDIDFHLQPENQRMTEDEKIEEICAQLYAYYRHTEELAPEKIEAIKTEISNKQHRPIWRNRVKQYELQKELVHTEKEALELESATELSTHFSRV